MKSLGALRKSRNKKFHVFLRNHRASMPSKERIPLLSGFDVEYTIRVGEWGGLIYAAASLIAQTILSFVQFIVIIMTF